MRNSWRIVLLAFLVCGSWLVGWAQSVHPDYVDGKIYLRQRAPIPDAAWQPLVQQFGIFSKKQPFLTPGFEQVYAVRFSQIHEVDALVRRLEDLAEVVYAERTPLYRYSFTPDDIDPSQWTMGRVEAERAWDVTRGSREVVVAVIDDGFYTSHEDLSGQLYVNPNEIPNDGIDNDGNGYIDDVSGYDVADDDTDPTPPNGAGWGMAHGTHVAGIAAASTNNGRGMASLAYDCSFLPIKAKHDTTIGMNQIDAAAEGIDYAISSGAKVVNMSFGGMGFSQTTQSLISAGYWNSGMVWVAAAGNNGNWQGFFPASYQHVISVTSTDPSDVLSGFSNYHPTVDLCAPGSGIYSAFVFGPDSYTFMSGTSMASPNAASLAALMLGINPGLGPDSLEACLKSSSDDVSALNPGKEGLIGRGRINAFRAVLCVPRLHAPVADFSFLKDSVCIGEVISFTDLSQEFPQHWQWDFGDGVVDTTQLAAEHAYAQAGSYSVQLIVWNNAGADTITFVDAITVLPAPSISVALGAYNAAGDSVTLLATGCPQPAWSPATGLSCTDCAAPMLSLADAAASYSATCTNSLGCKGSDSIATAGLVSAAAPVAAGFRIERPFPQPAGDEVVLRAAFERAGMLRVVLVDVQGRVLGTLVEERVAGTFERSLSLPGGLAGGMYLLRWEQQGDVLLQRLAVR